MRIVPGRMGDVSNRSMQRRSFSMVMALAEKAGERIESSTSWLWPKMWKSLRASSDFVSRSGLRARAR